MEVEGACLFFAGELTHTDVPLCVSDGQRAPEEFQCGRGVGAARDDSQFVFHRLSVSACVRERMR